MVFNLFGLRKNADSNLASSRLGGASFAAISSQSAPAAKPAADKKSSEPSAPHPSSVFEFGATVSVGKPFMRGVCTGEDPDAIHACTWSIEAVDAQSLGKAQPRKFRVEF